MWLYSQYFTQLDNFFTCEMRQRFLLLLKTRRENRVWLSPTVFSRKRKSTITSTSSRKDYILRIYVKWQYQWYSNSFLDIPDIRSTSHSIQSKKEKSAQLAYLCNKNMSKNGIKNLKLQYFAFNLNFISKLIYAPKLLKL